MNIFEQINEKIKKDKIALKTKLDKQMTEYCHRLTCIILSALNEVLSDGVMVRIDLDVEQTSHGQIELLYTQSGSIASVALRNEKIDKVWEDFPKGLKESLVLEQTSKQLSEKTGTKVIVKFAFDDCILTLDKNDEA